MKKGALVQIRLPDDLKDAFAERCSVAGISHSEAMRQLVQAATAYVDEYGRWYPPKLIPDIPQIVRPALQQVAESKGHYSVKLRKNVR